MAPNVSHQAEAVRTWASARAASTGMSTARGVTNFDAVATDMLSLSSPSLVNVAPCHRRKR